MTLALDSNIDFSPIHHVVGISIPMETNTWKYLFRMLYIANIVPKLILRRTFVFNILILLENIGLIVDGELAKSRNIIWGVQLLPGKLTLR